MASSKRDNADEQLIKILYPNDYAHFQDLVTKRENKIRKCIYCGKEFRSINNGRYCQDHAKIRVLKNQKNHWEIGGGYLV